MPGLRLIDLLLSQAVVHLLDAIDEVKGELQCEETSEEANSVKEVHEIVEESQEPPPMTNEMLTARCAFHQ